MSNPENESPKKEWDGPTTKTPASEGALGGLHAIVAHALEVRIKDPELCTPADINAAIKFLKDNNITATREANEALGRLERELGKQQVSEAEESELQAALDNIVQFPGSVAHGA
jgi:hypothetical protein